MLRKHTYNDELEQSKRNRGFVGKLRKDDDGDGAGAWGGREKKAREQLFEKTVTPSDVGKLNRLVIPKQHAEKHFPLQNGVVSSLLLSSPSSQSVSSAKGLLLNFEDDGGKVWRFRYSYWNSSQSYVLTKGWSRFVKEKNLKAGDTVCFHRSTGSDRQMYIDWKARENNSNNNMVCGEGTGVEGLYDPVGPVVEPVQMVRLFGVNILKMPVKRKEKEMLTLEFSKKAKMIGAL